MQQQKKKSLLGEHHQDNPEQKHPEHHIQGGRYLKSFIFGGLDGTINVLAVILGGIGSGASPSQILAFGLSLLVGAGLGMGLGDYLSAKAQKEFILGEQRRQQWQFQHKFDIESAEIKSIYIQKGYTQPQAKKLVQLFATNAKVFVDIMMLEQLGLVHMQTKPHINGIITLISFSLFGLIPMLPYIIGVGMENDKQSQYFVICLVIAAVLFVGLGYAKAAIVGFSPWRSAVETLVLGVIAVGIGYGVGILFQ